jgi:hypothetical protein
MAIEATGELKLGKPPNLANVPSVDATTTRVKLSEISYWTCVNSSRPRTAVNRGMRLLTNGRNLLPINSLCRAIPFRLKQFDINHCQDWSNEKQSALAVAALARLRSYIRR